MRLTIGYYEDAYDEYSFVKKVLQSALKEPPQVTLATHDLETDEYLDLEPTPITNKHILITDGAYLFKPVFQSHWDLKIYLKASFDRAMERGIIRDTASLGGRAAARTKFLSRYHAASRKYMDECDPENLADIVIDCNDVEYPKLLRNGSESGDLIGRI